MVVRGGGGRGGEGVGSKAIVSIPAGHSSREEEVCVAFYGFR